jgi:hypothetical protein
VGRLAVERIEGDATHGDARASSHRPARGADARDVVVVELVADRVRFRVRVRVRVRVS